MFSRIKKSLTALALTVGVAAVSAPALAANFAVNHHDDLAVNKVKGPLSAIVLGSSGPQLQTSGRASAGYLVFVDGKPFAIMDAGSGTFKSIAMSGAHIGHLNTILISHLHIDHVSELPGIIKGIYFDAHLFGAKQNHVQPIQIYGPDAGTHLMPKGYYSGTKAPLEFPSTSELLSDLFNSQTGMFRYLPPFVGNKNRQTLGIFGYDAHDLSSNFLANGKDAPINTIINTYVGGSQLTVQEVATDHFEAPAVAYRINYKGHSIVYTGDTHSTTDNIIRLAQGADILIYDTSILDTVPCTSCAFFFRHTTPRRIGEVAAAAGVKLLVLSHLTPVSEPNIESIIKEIRANGYEGKISVANDLKVYNTAPLE